MTASVPTFTLPLGYLITADGDIVSADGSQVRIIPAEHIKIATERASRLGRVPRFRDATPEEAQTLAAGSDGLARSFTSFCTTCRAPLQSGTKCTDDGG